MADIDPVLVIPRMVQERLILTEAAVRPKKHCRAIGRPYAGRRTHPSRFTIRTYTYRRGKLYGVNAPGTHAAVVDGKSVFFAVTNICRQSLGVVDLNVIVGERHQTKGLKIIQDTIGVIS